MCRVFTLLLHHSLLYCSDTAAEKGSEGCREACPPPRTGEGLPRSWKTPPTLHTCSLPFCSRAGGCGASSAEAPAWGTAFFQLLYNFKIYWCSRSSDICGMTQCRAPENLKSLNVCIKCPKFTSNGFIFIIMSGVYSTPVWILTWHEQICLCWGRLGQHEELVRICTKDDMCITQDREKLVATASCLLACQFGSEYFRTRAAHIGNCINMSLSLLWCDIISVSVFFSLWSWCRDVNTHPRVKTHTMNHICKVFQFQRVGRACDSENKSVALTPSPPVFFFRPLHLHPFVFGRGRGLCLCTCSSSHMKLQLSHTFAPNLSGILDPQPHHPSSVSHLLC